MRHNLKNPKHQAGLTLVELLIGVGIILVIIGGALALAPLVRADNQTAGLQQQVAQIASQTQALGRGNYNGLTEAVLVQSGKVPAAWVNSAGTGINHADGSTVTVAAANVNGGTDNGALLTFTAVRKSSCVSVLTNAQANFAVIGTDVVASAKAFGDPPMTSAEIVAACNSTGETVNLLLTVV